MGYIKNGTLELLYAQVKVRGCRGIKKMQPPTSKSNAPIYIYLCVCEMFLDTTINNMKYINQLSEQVNLGAYKKQGKGQPTLID